MQVTQNGSPLDNVEVIINATVKLLMPDPYNFNEARALSQSVERTGRTIPNGTVSFVFVDETLVDERHIKVTSIIINGPAGRLFEDNDTVYIVDRNTTKTIEVEIQ